MDVVFFNQPWRERQLKEGLQIALFGKADTYRGGLQMSNPVVDLIGDRTGRIVPIYPQSEKAQINTWEMAGWVEETLRRCAERGIADPVPDAVLAEHKMIPRRDALAGIHLPEDMRQKELARRRLAFDELLRVQLVLVLRKRALERDQRGFEHVDRRRPRPEVLRLAAVSAHRCTGAGDRRDLRRPRDRAPDAPPPPGRRRCRQDRGLGRGDARRGPERAPGRTDGADRGARRAARHQCPGDARRRQRSRSGQPVRRPPAPGRVADEPGDRRRTQGRDGRARRRLGRHRHRHPRADPGRGRLLLARRRRRRRAAPFRCRAAVGAARQDRRWSDARHARDDRHADPADGGDDRVRRPRRERARRTAARTHPDRDHVGERAADGDRSVARHPRRGGGGSAGLRRLPAGGREREARGRLRGGDVRATRSTTNSPGSGSGCCTARCTPTRRRRPCIASGPENSTSSSPPP